MKLYKYCSSKAGIEIIRNGRVKLSYPSCFNDPFDSLFDIDKSQVDESKELIFNYGFFTGLYETFHRDDLKLRKNAEKVIINDLRKKFDLCRQLMFKTKRYEPIPMLNSQLKALSNFDPKLKKKLNNIYEEFEKEVIDPIETLSKSAYISCFSKIPDSILMWSHYARSHSGVCIEIEEDRPDFKDVIYSSTRAKFELLDITKRVLGSKFLNEELDFSKDEVTNKMLITFLTKSTDWKYEDEVRCIISSNNPKIEGFEYSDLEPYLRVSITKIFIGLNTPEDELNEILKLAWARNIRVVYMEKHPTDFALVVNEERKQKPIFKDDPKLNSVEHLFQEMDGCLKDNHYLAALVLGLILPGILASVVYPSLNSKEGYIKLFDEVYGKYEVRGDKGTPYICGEICYELKNSLLTKGTSEIPHTIKDFEIGRVKFKVERKKNLQIFVTCFTKTTHIDGSTDNLLEINIREFCTNLYEGCGEILKTYKPEFDKLPKLDIFDLDKEFEDMIECSIGTRTINERIINYAKKKTTEN